MAVSPAVVARASELAKKVRHHRVDCIIDTNVIADVYTCASIVQTYQAGPSTKETVQTLYVRARARESLILLWHLHCSASTSWSLPLESTRTILKIADPRAATDFGTHWTTWVVWFVKDYILDRWNSLSGRDANGELKGNDCDDLLLETSRLARLPLITNEGYTPSGISAADPKKLRAKAIAAGVPVYTPRQFWSGKINPKRASRKFLARMDAKAPKFLKGHTRSPQVAKTLDVMRGIYQFILFGLTSQPGVRLRVERF